MLSAGVLYFVIICCGLFSEAFVRSRLVVAGNAAATATKILASPWLFKIGFASDLAAFVSDVAVAVLLYALLRPASKTGSLLAAGFRLTGAAIYGVNLLNYVAALLVLNGAIRLTAFTTDQARDLALLFLELHRHGYDLGLAFFGQHCLLLGWLFVRSELFPKSLGALMALAGMAYLVGSMTRFLWPDQLSTVAPIYAFALVGELALCGWLLIKGARMRRAGS